MRVLITGMSGTGKSSLVGALARAGHRAVDADDGWCRPLPDGRQLLDELAVDRLLASAADDQLLCVAACEENLGVFLDRFDLVVLLSAPAEVLLERVRTRTTNDFGKAPDEAARILADLAEVEPLLRRVAHHEIVTTLPLSEVVTTVETLIAAARPAGSRTRLGP